jgi:pimeloyl-ACP methyl ester carboxylesterase
LVETWVWRLFPADVPDFVAKLAAHDLTGVLPKLTCPLLILQGEEDGPETARRVHDEAGSQDKTLILYPPVAPGSRHVQVDGMLRAQADMGDWLANRFLV